MGFYYPRLMPLQVLNLQRQLQAAQAEGDSEKASALIDKLAILQGALGV